MKRLIFSDHAGLRLLAMAMDVRIMLLTVCILWAVLPSWGAGAGAVLDRLLFSASALLRTSAIDTRAYARVDVPAADMALLQHDPVAATSLMTFFRELQHTYTRGVAVVLPAPLWSDYSTHELLLSRLQPLTAQLEPAQMNAWQMAAANMRLYGSLLVDDRLFFSVAAPHAPVIGPVWQPQTFFRLHDDVRALPPGHVPQQTVDSLERPLLLQSQSLRTEARLELFLMQQGLRTPEWVPGQGVRLREHVLRSSSYATVLPRFSTAAEQLPLPRYALSQLQGQDVRRVLHEKTVVVGLAGDASADDLLFSTISLASGDYAVTPHWSAWFQAGSVLMVGICLLLLPWMSWRAGALLVVVFAFTLVLTQQILLLLHRDWLVVGRPLLLLGSGYAVMLLWAVRRHFYPLAKGAMASAVAATPEPVAGGLHRLFTRRNSVERVSPRLHETDTLLDTMPPLQSTARMSDQAVRPAAVVAARGGKPRPYLGRYQVQRELGRGAMGVVYLGFDPKISRQVAIKTLHYNQFDAQELPAVKERFFREAEAAGRLRHPNIVTIYDAGEEIDLAYIAMDYVSGDSLASYVHKGQLLDVEMVYWIMAQVADAVDYANAQGIIHRDIKPSNILFDNNSNEVKVADFGIARIMDGSATRTRTGDILGSPLYMSPEQLKGEGVSPRSDVFSLGVTLYQLLAGELPFKGENFANLSFQIVQGKYKPVDEVRPGLPDSARKITAKALQKNPDSRYAAAGDMADALQRALEKDFRR